MSVRRSVAATILAICLVVSPAGETTGDDADTKDFVRLAKLSRSVEFSIPGARNRMTPEDKFHLGRATAARLLTEYKGSEDLEATGYLNRVGNALALASERPLVFDGYRFILLESDEVNAFAVPGAFVLVTRGMMMRAEDEDMLAAVLAHEIAHVQEEHGLDSIKEKPWKKFWAVAFDQAFSELTGSALGKLSQLLGTMAGKYYETVALRGYDKDQEKQADEVAVEILRRTGYDPYALVEMLEAIDSKKARFAKTHPDTKKRIRLVRKLAGKASERPPERRQRFLEATAAVSR